MTLIVPAGSWLSKIIGGAISLWTGGWIKVILIGLVIGGLGLWFRLWLNKHDDRIFQDGQKRAIETLEVQYVATWQAKLTEAKNMADTADAHYKAAELQLAQVNMKIGAIFSVLSGIKKSVDERQVIYVKETAAIPRTELDATIRALSNYISALPAH